MCTLLVEYVPSLHRAVAPAGAPAGARTVGIWDDSALPEVGGGGVWLGADLPGAVLLVDRREVVRDVGVRDELVVDAVVCFEVADERLVLVDRVDGFLDVTSDATPPCAEHRPCVDLAVE